MSKRLNHARLAAIQNEWVKGCGVHARDAAKELGLPTDGIDDDEAALGYLVDSLLRGTSIPQFMIDEGLDWPAFSAWLKVDPKRDAAYEAAKKERGFIDRENLRHGWWQTANMACGDPVTHGDIHKAREAIAKSSGMFTEKVEHSGSLTVERITRTVIDPKPSNAA